jgi:hypothetical protein
VTVVLLESSLHAAENGIASARTTRGTMRRMRNSLSEELGRNVRGMMEQSSQKWVARWGRRMASATVLHSPTAAFLRRLHRRGRIRISAGTRRSPLFGDRSPIFRGLCALRWGKPSR